MKLRSVLFYGISLCMLCNSGTVKAQIIETIAGTGIPGSGGEGAPATSTVIQGADQMLKYDAAGNLYFADGNRIRKISTFGYITTVAGNSALPVGYGGDGHAATAAQLYTTFGIAFDASGNLYFSDEGNNTVRKVDAAGIITTVAGTGTAGYTNDGLAATIADLSAPGGIAFDAGGNLYIADQGNNVVRMVTPAGLISTYAGVFPGFSGYSGDGHHADSARFDNPVDVAFDASGNLYIADLYNNVVRKVNTSGIISTFAGDGAGAGGIGSAGYSGDGFAATLAELFNPHGIAFDAAGNLYISDAINDVVRKVNISNVISTVAGDHFAGYITDGVPATSTEINTPTGITVAPGGGLVFMDQLNYRIREVEPAVIASMTSSAGTTCQDSCITFTNTSTGSTDSITWSAPGISVSAPHSNIVSICFPNTGAITVTLIAYSGGAAYTATSVVTVNPVPHPVITRSGHTLTAPIGYGSYQWVDGSAIIPGATTNTYTYAASGTYTVVVDSGGCYGGALFSTLGIEQVNNGNADIALIPNPSVGIFTVRGNLSSITDEQVTLEVTNMIGNLVYSKTIASQQGTINAQISMDSHLPNGMYLLKLSTAQEIKVAHFVIDR